MTKDMTTGAITPLLVKFTIPLVLGNLFQLTYNAADSIIVGKFVGEDALAAVGTSNPLMTLAILFINGLCLGAGILVSTAYGAGDTQRVERQVSTTAIAGTVFSLVFSALCVLLATPLLRLMQVPEEILPIAVQYLRIVFAGLIFTFFYNFLAATMRALGDSKSALYFLMISSVLNIGGDLFFVEVLGWGSEGCALSTVLSEALCCVLCVVYIQFKVPVLQLGRRWLVFDSSLLRSTVQYGWTSAMQQATVQLGKIAVQAIVNTLGINAMAAFTAAGDVVDAAVSLSVYDSARGPQLSGRILELHPAGLGNIAAEQAALVQALRRGAPLTPEQKEAVAPERSHIITVYRELQARRWHAEDLQPLFAKLGEENTGKTLVAVAALEQVGLITAADRGGAKFWELVPATGKKNLADAPILKCLEDR